MTQEAGPRGEASRRRRPAAAIRRHGRLLGALAGLVVVAVVFGVAELGLTGALVAFGAGQPEAVAATLLYRALTVVPPLLLGLLAGATWRRHHRPHPEP